MCSGHSLASGTKTCGESLSFQKKLIYCHPSSPTKGVPITSSLLPQIIHAPE
jgi:hypothetical protein